MIDISFLEKVEAMSAPTITEIDGISRSNQKLYNITPPSAEAFALNSLSAILDFCESEMGNGRHALHIENQGQVSLFGPMDIAFRQRERFLTAGIGAKNFDFGNFHEVDKFIIALQAQFVQDDATAAILKLVGNMTKVAEVGTKDDGMTQRVEAKVGLAKVENVSIPNPVRLAPYRTFIEIDQPYSNFVLRLDSNHKCALFEADGGAWKIEAMKRIKTYLDNGLKVIGKRDQVTILC